MSTVAQHRRRSTGNQRLRRRLGQACAVAGALAVASALPAGANAQSRSGIFINNDVLNSLGPDNSGAPLAPLAPAAPPTPLSPRAQPNAYTPPQDGASLGFEPQGSGNVVVTRPGTLLFPPLREPSSTLAPGVGDAARNDAARKEAYDNAFAEGPEPRSQLLVPPDHGDNALVFGDYDRLVPADSSGSVLVFQDQLPASGAPPAWFTAPTPRPAPRKPEVPAEMLAAIRQASPQAGTAELAPEFQNQASQDQAFEDQAFEDETSEDEAFQSPETPEIVALPGPGAAQVSAEETAPAAPRESAEAAPAAVADNVAAETVAAADRAPVSLLPAADGATAAREATSSAATNDAAGELPEPGEPALQAASLEVGSVGADSVGVGSVGAESRADDLSFLFDGESAELSDQARAELSSLADSLRASEEGRVQVLGFASRQDGSQDLARKLALSRALKVRTFLIDAGVASARIQVRSLGDKSQGGPANRVDIRSIGS